MPLAWLPAQANYLGKLGNVAIDHRTLDEKTFVTENFEEWARRGASRPVLVLGIRIADADGKDSDSNECRLGHIGPPTSEPPQNIGRERLLALAHISLHPSIK